MLICIRPFLSTPSARRATPFGYRRVKLKNDFYPRPPRGGRLSSWSSDLADIIFLSTPSARRATPALVGRLRFAQISIHALREEGDARATAAVMGACGISIHALREEGDGLLIAPTRCLCNFYPRPPRGGRPFLFRQSPLRCYFYPRPPRGGRRRPQIVRMPDMDFYPRPPRGGRRGWCVSVLACYRISIHALREEGDMVILPSLI